MEELNALEIRSRNVTGKPDDLNRFVGTALEFEYGATTWWTSEVYLDGQTTRYDSSSFTGFRWENRFHVFRGQHWINPVLYVEFENLTAADRALLEVVGNDTQADLTAPTRESRHDWSKSIETKLILDSRFKGWTIAENIIAEKEFGHEPWEFGYAVGISRPLSRNTNRPCGYCLGSLVAGVEAYGGLGTTNQFGFHDTSPYIGPVLAWSPGHETTVMVSPSFGVSGNSVGLLLRFGVSYEVDSFGKSVMNLFRKSH